MKSFKIYSILIILSFFLIPTQMLAYSNYIIPGGQSVGIKIETNGILVVGTYTVSNKNPAIDAGIRMGDYITHIDNIMIKDIDSMIKLIDESSHDNIINITFRRGSNILNTKLNVVLDNDVYKTGLYVKDNINGLGTLTYIDPSTLIYGALGHEIIEKNTALKVDVKDGSLFKTEVTNINKSTRGNPGEKNAKFYTNTQFGNIKENTKSGLFGIYQDKLPTTDAIEVASRDEIKLGNAVIRTVLNGDVVEEFSINIIKLNLDENTMSKNILFEITDSRLLNETGGIVQGMSGSPIIQDNKIIGAVSHVVVDDVKKGYGIYIVNMLKEGEN